MKPEEVKPGMRVKGIESGMRGTVYSVEYLANDALVHVHVDGPSDSAPSTSFPIHPEYLSPEPPTGYEIAEAEPRVPTYDDAFLDPWTGKVTARVPPSSWSGMKAWILRPATSPDRLADLRWSNMQQFVNTPRGTIITQVPNDARNAVEICNSALDTAHARGREDERERVLSDITDAVDELFPVDRDRMWTTIRKIREEQS